MEVDTHVLAQYAPQLLHGLLITLAAIGAALVLSALLGLLACAAELSGDALAARLARGYINLFRVVPDIVLVFWVYYCLPPIFDLRLSALSSGILALSLTMGAYMAEV